MIRVNLNWSMVLRFLARHTVTSTWNRRKCPAPQVGMQFPDSAMIAHRLRETHTNGYQRAYLPDVWANTRQYGLNIGVNAAKDDEFGFAKAPAFKNGIKNRLQVINYTPETLDAIKIDFPLARNRWKASLADSRSPG